MSISIYTSAQTVYHKLVQLFPGENISEDDVYDWCMDAEINHISDGDLFVKYVDIPIEIDGTLGIGALPCNVKRIIDVYKTDGSNIDYHITAKNHIKVKGQEKRILLTYLGLTLDNDGLPRIMSSHVIPLVTFCKIQVLEPKVLMGKFNAQLFMKYEQQFSGQVTAVKQSANNKDREHYHKVNVIQWNMIRKPAQKRLFKNMFV